MINTLKSKNIVIASKTVKKNKNITIGKIILFIFKLVAITIILFFVINNMLKPLVINNQLNKQIEQTKQVEHTDNKKQSGKNEKHSNEKRRQSAKEKYDKLKKEYDKLHNKRQKEPSDKKILKKIENQLKHLKKKIDFKGENHSNKGKGYK